MSVIYWIDINLSGLNLSSGEAARLKHELDGGLELLGIGEVIGGGTMLDGSAIDIEFETNTLDAKDKLLEFFRDKNLQDCIKIHRE